MTPHEFIEKWCPYTSTLHVVEEMRGDLLQVIKTVTTNALRQALEFPRQPEGL